MPPPDEAAMHQPTGAPRHAAPFTKFASITFQNAGSEEPIFVLRGQDKAAPATVRAWAAIADALGAPPEKVAEARAIADAMEAWPFKKVPD